MYFRPEVGNIHCSETIWRDQRAQTLYLIREAKLRMIGPRGGPSSPLPPPLPSPGRGDLHGESLEYIKDADSIFILCARGFNSCLIGSRVLLLFNYFIMVPYHCSLIFFNYV